MNQQQRAAVTTTGAAAGSTAGGGIVLVWLLSQFHIDMPSEVALALVAMASPLVHFVAMKIGAEPVAPVPPAAPAA